MTAVIVVPNRTKLRVLRSNAPFGVFFHSGSPGSVQFSCRGAFTPDNPPETPTPKLAVPTVVPNRNGTASSAVQCTLWSNLPRWLTRVSAVLAWRCVHPGRFTQDVCTKVGSSCRRSQSNRTASSAAQCTLRSDLPRWLTRVRAVLAWRCFHPGQFTQGAKKKTLSPLRWFVPGTMSLLRAFASVTGVIWPSGSAPAHVSHALPLLAKGGRQSQRSSATSFPGIES